MNESGYFSINSGTRLKQQQQPTRKPDHWLHNHSIYIYAILRSTQVHLISYSSGCEGSKKLGDVQDWSNSLCQCVCLNFPEFPSGFHYQWWSQLLHHEPLLTSHADVQQPSQGIRRFVHNCSVCVCVISPVCKDDAFQSLKICCSTFESHITSLLSPAGDAINTALVPCFIMWVHNSTWSIIMVIFK